MIGDSLRSRLAGAVGALVFFLVCFSVISAQAWQQVAHEDGQAIKIEGRMVSGDAETSGRPYILIEPRRVLPALDGGIGTYYRNVVFNYGDNYICGIEREIKIHIDGQLVTEPGAPDVVHVFRKGFLSAYFGEVLTYESFENNGAGQDLARRLLAAKREISFERIYDDCGDGGRFIFPVKTDAQMR
jgi:hypothetical protein